MADQVPMPGRERQSSAVAPSSARCCEEVQRAVTRG